MSISHRFYSRGGLRFLARASQSSTLYSSSSCSSSLSGGACSSTHSPTSCGVFTTQRRHVVEYDDVVTAIPGIRLPGTPTEPLTQLSPICDHLSECAMRYDELKSQIAAQEKAQKEQQQQQAGGGAAASMAAHNPKLAPLPILSNAVMEEFVGELRSTALRHMESLQATIATPGMVQAASIGELRRVLYYAVTLRGYGWVSELMFAQLMKTLSREFVRRGKIGALAQDDVVYIATFVAVADYYNKPLWTALEFALNRGTFTALDKQIVKGMTTRLFKSKPSSRPESVDLRRQLLKSMSRRVGELCNEFELPHILRIIQCYTVHDIFPKPIFDLATRAMMHVQEYNPQESATLCQIFRKWRILTPEVCDRLLEKILTAEVLTSQMASYGLMACKMMYRKLATGAASTEVERQKLRQLGERLASRLDEVQFTSHIPVLQCLDAVVGLRLYLPHKTIQAVFAHAGALVVDNPQRMNLDEGRQLLALLEYFGIDFNRPLAVTLRKLFKEGALEEETII
eukprot:PhM_4_TR10814/c0_g1_i1/m.40097